MKISVQEIESSSMLLREVLEGLQRPQKTLPSKYFYDKRGSELFEKICELDEYYLTRTELSIMKENVGEIANQMHSDIQLVELGSGSSFKTRLLLDHLPNIHSYIPVDISYDFLAETVEQLQSEYESLKIIPVAADYTQAFELPKLEDSIQRIVFYPGSTIGNFTEEKASEFLELIANQLESNDGLLIGFDLLKDREVLLAAYDDAKGVTAAFNKNILRRINRELDANFNPDLFEHSAVFDEDKSRIEMHLVSKKDQVVEILGNTIEFESGETIHTENSHKYSLESFNKLTSPYFKTVQTWTDENEYFAVQLLRKDA